MSDWTEYKLGELIKLKYGKDHKPLQDGIIPAYGSGGIMRFVNQAIYKGPSILIPRKGSLNNVIYINTPFWTVDTMFWSIINEEIVDSRFLYYAICKYNFEDLNVGSAIPSLTVPVIEAVRVKLPTKEIQTRIADIIDSVNEKIDTNRKINARLEELAQAIFKSWFIDFEPFGGKMPEDWEYNDFDNVVEVIAGGTPKTEVKEYWNGNIPWISVKDFVNEPHFVMNTERYISEEGLTNSSTHLLEPEDTIISARGTVGAIAQIQKPMAFNQSCFGLRCKLNYGSYWLYYLMLNKVAELKQKSHGSVFDTINRKTLSDLRIMVPSSKVLAKFHSTIASTIRESLSLSKESSRLAALRDTLLPKLMSGELLPE